MARWIDALVSLGFNAGRWALVRSGVVEAIQAGDNQGAARAILRFRAGHGNGTRRACEARLFRDGVYAAR
jgi:GH24 family phage-related lysozyme (muramidase)